MGFGKNLSMSLKYHGISVKELSRRTGISAQTLYSCIRRDSSKVDFDFLKRIEDAIGDPEFPLSTAQMDFPLEYPYHLIGKFQSKMPKGYGIRLCEDQESVQIVFPDKSVSDAIKPSDVNKIFDSINDYAEYEFNKLKPRK